MGSLIWIGSLVLWILVGYWCYLRHKKSRIPLTIDPSHSHEIEEDSEYLNDKTEILEKVNDSKKEKFTGIPLKYLHVTFYATSIDTKGIEVKGPVHHISDLTNIIKCKFPDLYRELTAGVTLPYAEVDGKLYNSASNESFRFNIHEERELDEKYIPHKNYIAIDSFGFKFEEENGENLKLWNLTLKLATMSTGGKIE